MLEREQFARETQAGFLSCAARRIVLVLEGFVFSVGAGFIGTLLMLTWMTGPLTREDGIAGGAWILLAAIVAVASGIGGIVFSIALTAETSDRGFGFWKWILSGVGLLVGISLLTFVHSTLELEARVIVGLVLVPIVTNLFRLLAPLMPTLSK